MDPAEAFAVFMEQKYPDLWVELNKFAKSKKRKIVTPSAPKRPEPPRNEDGSLNIIALDAEVATLMMKYKYEPDVAWERVSNKYGLVGSRSEVRMRDPAESDEETMAERAAKKAKTSVQTPQPKKKAQGIPDVNEIHKEIDQYRLKFKCSLEEAVYAIKRKYGLDTAEGSKKQKKK